MIEPEDDEVELLPCPFCAGYPRRVATGATCINVRCALYGYSFTVERWNTRVPIERAGTLYYRELPDGSDLCVYPLSVGWGQLALTRAGRSGICESYYYLSRDAAIAAASTWDGQGDAPVGWFRHPQSGRRRKDGDPAQEYIQR